MLNQPLTLEEFRKLFPEIDSDSYPDIAVKARLALAAKFFSEESWPDPEIRAHVMGLYTAHYLKLQGSAADGGNGRRHLRTGPGHFDVCRRCICELRHLILVRGGRRLMESHRLRPRAVAADSVVRSRGQADMKKTISVSIVRHDGELNQALKRLAKTAVYVGIAAGSKDDTRNDGGPSNHLLGFVHENGSPVNNIPPRPFLVPGLEANREMIVDGLKGAMDCALKGDEKKCGQTLERLAIRSASAVKSYMQTADFEPLKPRTIANRNRSRLTQGTRENEMEGVGIRPLINTGQLRDAIDGVVVEE